MTGFGVNQVQLMKSLAEMENVDAVMGYLTEIAYYLLSSDNMRSDHRKLHILWDCKSIITFTQ